MQNVEVMMKSTQEAAQNHSVVEYLQRLSTKELLHLLRCCFENESTSAFYAKEIISILDSRFDETKKQQAR